MPDAATQRQHTNRLAETSSPYLLQHAHNPVDWRPWGEAAFEAARERDVPIFLSIGYSTCYWCHVMERESFESEDIAAQMNDGFVCIKADREQRPDVDDIYMTATQLLTGRGGWPMSVFLTPPGARGPGDPGLEPFWAGTYFPPEPRMNMPSFPQVLTAMRRAWDEQRDAVLSEAERVTQAVRAHLAAERSPVRLERAHVEQALSALAQIHDAQRGGFGGAPKFPQPVFLEFLLEAGAGGDARVDEMLRRTLDRMAMGGMHDQAGGGFHRYSVDAQWLVPHFEKMLYDNGQLASVYARAHEVYGDPFYARTARRTCEYVLREMATEQGAFYSAQDAEVDGREGLNYLWTPEQVKEVLGDDDAPFAMTVYGLDGGPNFQDPHHQDEPARNVLHLVDHPASLAEKFGLSLDEFWSRLDRVSAALLEARAQRKQPGTDDKVLASWNGLMIAGLADAGRALDEPRFVEAAKRAADFVLERMVDEDGNLLRAWRDGEAGIDAILEDHAFVIRGLLALHEAGAGNGYVDEARDLAQRASMKFAAPEGGYFDTAADQTDLIVRATGAHDGAVPCASSVMLNDLLTIYEITGDQRWLDKAGDALGSVSRAIAGSPLAAINSTRALRRVLARDAALLGRFGLGESAPEARAQPSETPVQILASEQSLTVGEGEPAELTLELRIADGFHVNAHEPGARGLTGLDVHVDGGMGYEAQADFPAGEALQGEFVPEGETLSVHTGTVRVPVTIRRTGEPLTGVPRLVVTYQACTETECLQPMTATLGIEIKAG